MCLQIHARATFNRRLSPSLNTVKVSWHCRDNFLFQSQKSSVCTFIRLTGQVQRPKIQCRGRLPGKWLWSLVLHREVRRHEICRGNHELCSQTGLAVGRSIAIRLAGLGVKIVSADLRDSPNSKGYEADIDKTTSQVIAAAGGEAIFFAVDITDIEAVQRLFNKTRKVSLNISKFFSLTSLTHQSPRISVVSISSSTARDTGLLSICLQMSQKNSGQRWPL